MVYPKLKCKMFHDTQTYGALQWVFPSLVPTSWYHFMDFLPSPAHEGLDDDLDQVCCAWQLWKRNPWTGLVWIMMWISFLLFDCDPRF